MRRAVFLLVPVCLTLWCARSTHAERPLRFNRDIRPILSENCYFCHGPDASARQADLRLDTEEGAKEWSVVEGDSESSEVIARIFTDDPDTVMPPPDSERALTTNQKETLRRWVDEGAAYEKHWSFEPPVAPNVPAAPVSVATVSAEDGQRTTSPIDRFVLRRLDEESIPLAPAADKATLLRRITFDLIGLPPTLSEIDDYLADASEQATEKVIDRLLSDPRFGERMAASWLDVARYSDTYGYQVDRDRFVWPYRDWVVRAFNENLPYDDFVRHQLAGDLLPGASDEQVLATTFNRLHPQKVEGGSVPEEFRIEYVADRTQTFGTAFLGLTLECCRCHTHKYDPITQTEYYQLASFFSNIDEAGLYSFFTPSVPTPTLALPTDTQAARLAALETEVRESERQYRELLTKPLNPKGVHERIEVIREQETFFATPIESADFEDEPGGRNEMVSGVAGNAIRLTGDDAFGLKQGNFRRDQPFSVSLWIKTPDLKERAVIFHRSRAWTDAGSRGYQLLIENGHLSWSLIHFWPGNAIRIRTPDPIPTEQWVHVVVSSNGSGRADGLTIALDGKRSRAEVVRDKLTKNITGGGGDKIAIGQRFRDRGFASGEVDSFRVFDVELTDLEIERLAERDETLQWIASASVDWEESELLRVADHLRRRHSEPVSDQRGQLGQKRRQLFQLQDGLKEIMVMRESPGIRKTFRLERGMYDSPAEEVGPGTPKAIRGFEDSARDDRLGLANWMLQEDHPLTSRVAVNRLWQLCFGVGLVRTPEDFGSQGAPPTHPELLDWLATDFVRGGWDVKRMIKQIMLTATYQAASDHPDADVYRLDPENRRLARHNAYRIPAEMLRDQALATSGQLVSQIGGAPVKPYEVSASFKPTKHDQGAGLYRRSLYTYWKRTGPAPAMMTLDASKRDVCRVRRERTSSPLQAFVLLNGPQYVESARMLAADLIMQENEDQSTVLANAFRVLTSRNPNDAEREVIATLYQQQLDYFRKHPDRSKAYLDIGETKWRSLAVGASVEPHRLAATAVVVGTLMNFDESVMKR